jgi:hypothetical protein
MRSASTVVLLGLLLAGNASAQEKDRPVSKIIVMLKDMIAQLEKEGEEDEDIMETMACWCETNDKLKTQAIADGKQRIDALTAAIEELTANSARLNTEIGNLNKEVSKNQRALDQASALRSKNNAEFIAEEKDLLQSIGSMKAAIIALSKHNKGAALLQMDDSESIDLIAKLGHVMRKHADILGDSITPHQRDVLKAFVQQGAGYAPQSGEIFGIMQAMKESFEINLATSQKMRRVSWRPSPTSMRQRLMRSRRARTRLMRRPMSWPARTRRMPIARLTWRRPPARLLRTPNSWRT